MQEYIKHFIESSQANSFGGQMYVFLKAFLKVNFIPIMYILFGGGIAFLLCFYLRKKLCHCNRPQIHPDTYKQNTQKDEEPIIRSKAQNIQKDDKKVEKKQPKNSKTKRNKVSKIKILYIFIQYFYPFLNRKLRARVGMRGLDNLGNTCFMNSAIQCLHKTFELQNVCQKSKKRGELKRAYIYLCRELSKLNQRPFSPDEIKRLVQEQNQIFMGYNQNDSCEWVGSFLSKLQDELNLVKKFTPHNIDNQKRRHQSKEAEVKLWRQSRTKDQKRKKSVIDNVIYGRYRTKYTCKACGQLYIMFQKFHAVYLPIPQRIDRPTLRQCWSDFCKVETLDGDNMMNCKHCNTDQVTDKIMTVYETNKILIVCLKRFNETMKIDKEVDVPLVLSAELMRETGNRSNYSYELYGMIIHSGSLRSGHYIAVCYDSTNKWVQYNDSSYKQIRLQREVIRMARSAYVLFYRRKNIF